MAAGEVLQRSKAHLVLADGGHGRADDRRQDLGGVEADVHLVGVGQPHLAVEATHFLEQIGAVEHGAAGQRALRAQEKRRKLVRGLVGSTPQVFVVLIDRHDLADGPVGTAADDFRGFVQGVGQVSVIGVEDADNRAGRPAQRGVDRLGRPGIPGALPMLDFVFVRLDDVEAGIGRPAVHHDQLEVVVVLVEDRADGPLQEEVLIEVRDDDGDAGGERRGVHGGLAGWLTGRLPSRYNPYRRAGEIA